jgi:hypothetical protein
MPKLNLRQGVALAGLFLLASCGGGADGGGNGAVAVAPTPDAAAKISAYTEAYNALIDTFGLPKTAEEYKEARIAKRSPADNISISQGWVETAHGKLKAARALPGALGQLDAKAEVLDTVLAKLMARLGPLYSYYNTKAYRQDVLKRGKAEDAQMTAEFDAALKALDEFDAALVTQRRAGAEAELARLKADGDTVGYHNKAMMQQAEDLVQLFDKPEDLKDAAVFAKADGIVASLEKLLAEQQKAVAAGKAKATEPLEKSRLGTSGIVGDMLGSMIGSYRQLKQSHSAGDMQSMVDSYNRAVGMANNIR